MEKGLKEKIDEITKTISTLDTFSSLRYTLRHFLEELGGDSGDFSKQGRLK